TLLHKTTIGQHTDRRTALAIEIDVHPAAAHSRQRLIEQTLSVCRVSRHNRSEIVRLCSSSCQGVTTQPAISRHFQNWRNKRVVNQRVHQCRTVHVESTLID